MNPQVTVLMAVRNGDRYLGKAIGSVRSQTFRNWELVLVDDNSTDDTLAIAKDAAGQCDRVRVIHLDRDVGLAAALNAGLAQSRGDLVARLDGDDVSLPGRLAQQVNHLDAHPETGIVGSAFFTLDAETDVVEVQRHPYSHAGIRWQLLFVNAFCHSSVMFRRQVVSAIGGYDEKCRVAQDHDLWVRLAEHTGMANLPEPLVVLRMHDASVSSLHPTRQEEVSLRLCVEQVRQRMRPAPDIEVLKRIRLHRLWSPDLPVGDVCQWLHDYSWLLRLSRAVARLELEGGARLRRLQRTWTIQILARVSRNRWRLLASSGVLREMLLTVPWTVARNLGGRALGLRGLAWGQGREQVWYD